MMGGAYNMNERDKKCHTILIEEPEGKRPLNRTRLRWEDNIKTNLKKILWEGVD
jgi:hypothetical protein